MSLSVVILAAGQGKRMRSHLPKVLHPIGGQPMLAHVVNTVSQLKPHYMVVVHGANDLRSAIYQPVLLVKQEVPLGTGDAVACGLRALPPDAASDQILVVYGDTPLVTLETLQLLQDPQPGLYCLSVVLEQPQGYGRILRNAANEFQAICEERDANSEQKKIKEINSGILSAPYSKLQQWLPQLQPNNAQQEIYLTDVVALAVAEGFRAQARITPDAAAVMGINDRIQLSQVERQYQQQQVQRLMLAGATLRDPARVDIRGEIEVGMDVTIDINVILSGKVQLADQVRIGAHCSLHNCIVEHGAEIAAHSVLEDCIIGANAHVGPFARIRSGTELKTGARVGNFVETKKAIIGKGSKINHLSYIGDTEMGADVNIGAGTITCNYDGIHKFKTMIGDEVFIGSNSALVAPVKIADTATIGAGSTVTGEISAGLTFTRAPQTEKPNWIRPKDRK